MTKHAFLCYVFACCAHCCCKFCCVWVCFFIYIYIYIYIYMKNLHCILRNEAYLLVHESSKLVFVCRCKSFMRFEIFTVVRIRIVVWFVALFSSVGGLKCFGGRYHIFRMEAKSIMFHLGVGTIAAVYTKAVFTMI